MGNKTSRDIFQGVCHQMISTTVEANDQDCWDDLWKNAVSITDVFDLLTSADVSQIIDERPENMKLLFTQVCIHYLGAIFIFCGISCNYYFLLPLPLLLLLLLNMWRININIM